MPTGLDHLPPEILGRLRQTYLGHLSETRGAIAPLVEKAVARTAAPDDYATLKHAAHKLGGSGASYGYDGLSKAGKALDGLLRTEAGATDAIGRAAFDLLAAIDEALTEA